MRRSFSATPATVALASGAVLGVAAPSDAATTVTVGTTCKFSAVSTTGIQTQAKDLTCTAIQASISYVDGNRTYTVKGDKVGKNLTSVATANFSMLTGHAVTAWIPNGDVVTKQF